MNHPFDTVGLFTFIRTYARKKDDGKSTETWEETLNRVIDSCVDQLKVPFDNEERKELFELFYNLKCSVAGRFLWQLGTKTVDRLGLPSLQNCACVYMDGSVDTLTWLMNLLMLGCGVGFVLPKDTTRYPVMKYAENVRQDTNDADYIVPDKREGWVSLYERVLMSHFVTGKSFTYSCVLIRSKGAAIKSFGGVASGPDALCAGVSKIDAVCNAMVGRPLRPIDFMDLACIIAEVVVSGNVRRSALLSLGDYNDKEYLYAKNWARGDIPSYRSNVNCSVVCNDINEILNNDDFWAGYNGSGEPFGLINLALSKKCGRIGETQYPDPTVIGYNPCVPGDTWVMTSDGPRQVSELIGKQFTAIVDGEHHQSTKAGFWKTGEHTVTHIETIEGFSISATNNHLILNQDNNWVEFGSLKPGDKISLHEHNDMNWAGIGSTDEGYLLGQLVGDGTFSKQRAVLYSWGETSKPCRDYIEGILKSKPHRSDFIGWAYVKSHNVYRIQSKYLTSLATEFGIFQGSKHTLSSKIEKSSYAFYQGFISGLFDADGTVCHNPIKGSSVRLNQSNYSLLQIIQRMLLRMGIYSRIYKRRDKMPTLMPNGRGGTAMYDRKENYDLVISKSSMIKYSEQIGFKESEKSIRLGGIVNGYKRCVSQSEFTATVKTTKPDIETIDVYDCTVPGVSAFDANGFYVHNCAEQSLSNYETCCLAELFLPKMSSKDELKKCAMYLYRICKHSLMLPFTESKESEAIIHANMRMGLGISGYLQATEEQRGWLSDTYEYIRDYDLKYSRKLGVPTSIKLTTVKPSGTLSLLPGVTAGGHPGFARWYIRRIRLSSGSPLVKLARDHNYHVEFQRKFGGGVDYDTSIVSFPYALPEHTVFSKDCGAIQQLEYVKRLQHEWSDNSVSVTVYYKLDELPAIKEWLRENYNNNVKSVSFLLHSGHGFDQAPLEEITEQRYNEMMKQCLPIHDTSIRFHNYENDIESECAGGACPVR